MKKSLLTLCLSLFLIACGGDKPVESPADTTTTSPTNATQPAPITNPNAIKVRVTVSAYTPFVTRDDKGLPTGFDIDILQAIANLEGLHLEITERPWAGALQTLNTGQSDIVASAVSLNPARIEQYLPSNPYISTPNSLVVLADSPIHNIDDLKGKVIGIEAGSSFLAERSKYPNTEFKELKTSFLALSETITKKVDAVVAHRLHLQYLLRDKDVKVRFIDLPTANPDKVIMVKKGNVELVQKINSGLEKIKADGTYDAIYKKWFGEDMPQ